MGANEKYDAAMHGAEYTPYLEDLRTDYVFDRGHDGESEDEARAEFDRFIAKIKAEAWDACARSIVYEDGTPVQIMSITNPYKEAPNA